MGNREGWEAESSEISVPCLGTHLSPRARNRLEAVGSSWASLSPLFFLLQWGAAVQDLDLSSSFMRKVKFPHDTGLKPIHQKRVLGYL